MRLNELLLICDMWLNKITELLTFVRTVNHKFRLSTVRYC